MSHPNAIVVHLSPTAARFVVAALERQQAEWQHQLDAGELDEDAAADARNDWAFVASIRADLLRAMG